MSKSDDIQQTLYEAAQILERALLLIGDAPFFMYCDRPDFARLTVAGETA